MKVVCEICGEEYEVEDTMQGKQFPCFTEGCNGIIEVPVSREASVQTQVQSKILHLKPKAGHARKNTLQNRRVSPARQEYSGYSDSYSDKEDILHLLKNNFSMQKNLYVFQAILTLLSWTSGILYVTNLYDDDYMMFFLITFGCYLLFLLFFLYHHVIFMYNLWQLAPQGKVPTTPGKAIWMNFVPFLFPFWQWITYYELGKIFSDISGKSNCKVQSFIFSLMNFMGMAALFIPWGAVLLSMESEFIEAAENCPDEAE